MSKRRASNALSVVVVLVVGPLACQPLAGIESKSFVEDAGADVSVPDAAAPACEASQRTCRDGKPLTCDRGAFVQAPACLADSPSCFLGDCVRGRTLALASDTSCVRLGDATARCWGASSYGTVGDGTAKERRTPTQVTDLRNVTELVAGTQHVCARLGDGLVSCWGKNDTAQLGDPGVVAAYRPSPATVPGVANVVGLAAGEYHTCALTLAGVLCWGGNADGEIGDGTGEDRPAATAVKGLPSVPVEIAAGGAHTCARFTDGTVACWGRNADGQIGDGASAGDRTMPSLVKLPMGATHLALGDAHSCARVDNGDVYCWGANAAGQLGDESNTTRVTPVRVHDLLATSEIAAGRSHTCARLANGIVTCWGQGNEGELGNGGINPSSKPVIVLDLTDAIEIDAGGSHTCALRADRTVVCWGDNSAGQIGDGSNEQRRAPVTVPVRL